MDIFTCNSVGEMEKADVQSVSYGSELNRVETGASAMRKVCRGEYDFGEEDDTSSYIETQFER